MQEGKNKKNGGINTRMGIKFYQEIEKIKDARLLNGKSKSRVSTEKLTNMITRHLNWKVIAKEIIESSEEEIEKYGL